MLKRMKNIKVFYLVYDSILNTVFDSQVLNYLVYLKKAGISPELISFERNIKSENISSKLQLIKNKQINVRLIKRLPFIGRLLLYPLARKLFFIIRDLITDEVIIIIHCRGQISTYIAIKAKRLLLKKCQNRLNVKIVGDIRGIIDEIRCSNWGWKWVFNEIRYHEAIKIEKLIYKQADGLSCVSYAMKKDLIDRFKLDPNKIIVVHCAVNKSLFNFRKDTRKKIRQEMNLKNDIVFVYSGSLAPWQAPNKLFTIMHKIKSVLPNSQFIILTRDILVAKRYLEKNLYNNLTGFHILSADYLNVHTYLLAADVGLLIREQNKINKIAFPTKYAEYLSCGLFILSSDAVDDIVHYTNKYPLTGLIFHRSMDDNEEINELIRKINSNELLSDKYRLLRSQIAVKEFSSDELFPKYLELYKKISI